jgi:hypothetical protein
MLRSYSLAIALLTSKTDQTETTPNTSRQPIYAIPLAALEMNTSFLIGAL